MPPLLIRNGSDDFLVGHPHPPDGFAPAAGVQIDGRPVFRRSGHLVPVPAATAWNVAGVWSVAVPERAEFQAAVDQWMMTAGAMVDIAMSNENIPSARKFPGIVTVDR